MSNWHVGKNKFALTSTIHITTHNTKVANDKEWLTQKVSHSKMARLQNHAEDNSILTGKPQNMRRQMHHIYDAGKISMPAGSPKRHCRCRRVYPAPSSNIPILTICEY